MSLPPADPHAAHVAAKRRASLTRRVGAVTRVTTVVALTSTGGVVGALAREAHEADVLAAQRQVARPETVVVPSPVARPVRTVVVRRPAVVRQALQPRPTRSQPEARKARPPRASSSTQGRPAPAQRRPAPAPRVTQSPPATRTSGS